VPHARDDVIIRRPSITFSISKRECNATRTSLPVSITHKQPKISTMTMPFRLNEVRSAAEFNSIWPVHFQAFRDPYNSFSKFFNPVHTTFDAAIQASKTRHVAIWEGDPASHWIKVTETDTGQVVGAAQWDINDTGYAEGDGAKFKAAFEAHQHTEGTDEKLFAEKLIGGLRSAIMDRVRVPHMGKYGARFTKFLTYTLYKALNLHALELKQMVVHPEYRYRGVAKMLVGWGFNQADKRGVETIVVSVPYSRPVYTRMGFKCIKDIEIDFSVPNASKRWKEWQAEDLRAFLMVRPAKAS
jgi:GNAT superfamily N-acetyltransferase